MRILTTMLTTLALMSFASVASAMCNGLEHQTPDQTAEVPPILIPPKADT